MDSVIHRQMGSNINISKTIERDKLKEQETVGRKNRCEETVQITEQDDRKSRILLLPIKRKEYRKWQE
jgi:hypothetical protein